MSWFARRREAQRKSQFNRGYDFAVGAMLRGEHTEEQLFDMANCPFDHTDFDRGIVAGLRALAQDRASS